MNNSTTLITAPPEYKYCILLGLYVGFWGILQSITVKLVPLDLSYLGLGMLAFSYGSFAHAFTFPCTDAVAEVWGPKRARLMVYLGAAVYIIATFLIYIATLLPAAEGWPHNDAYVTLFSAAPRIVAGSIVATLFALPRQMISLALVGKSKAIVFATLALMPNDLARKFAYCLLLRVGS